MESTMLRSRMVIANGRWTEWSRVEEMGVEGSSPTEYLAADPVDERIMSQQPGEAKHDGCFGWGWVPILLLDRRMQRSVLGCHSRDRAHWHVFFLDVRQMATFNLSGVYHGWGNVQCLCGCWRAKRVGKIGLELSPLTKCSSFDATITDPAVNTSV